uniref:Ig-like domain-containing protein n=1 Tax=Ficedula albicollis TaxID=59894 RepID=U3JQ54_FICAL
QKVWVREGSSAVLPCHLNPRKTREGPKQLSDKISVLWKRQGGRYASVKRDTSPSGGMEGLEPRVSLQDSSPRHGNFSLRIDPVRSEDVGLYEAQVKHQTEVHGCHVELGVITGRRGWKTWRMLILSHRASLVETCWFHDKHPGPTSRTFCSLSTTLSILHPAVSDAGSWRCQLRYSDKEIISAAFNLQILGFDGPSNPVVYAAAGSAANLPCSLSYLPSAFGMGVVAAHWSHLAGGHLQDWGISQNLSSRSFPLHLPAVGLGDAGQYRCTVSVGRRTISRDVTLAVLTVTPSIQGPVSEGSRFLLICILTHAQGNERFQWTHLDSGHSPRTGPNLEIPQVSQQDTGTWECSVYGPEGRLGAVEYDLQITGTVPHGSANNLFLSPYVALWCPFLILSFSPWTTWIPSSCHPLLAFTSSSCCSFQFPALSPILSVVVQSHAFLGAKSTIPSSLTLVPPHRRPGLQCSLHLQWADYFWAHTQPLLPACCLCSGSGPTKKGKCLSPHFCSFSCTSTLI